jgi:hypothetical protein
MLKPILLSLMVVLGVTGVIVWQAGLLPGVFSARGQASGQTQAVAKPNEPKPAPQTPPAPDLTAGQSLQKQDSTPADGAPAGLPQNLEPQNLEPTLEKKPSPLAEAVPFEAKPAAEPGQLPKFDSGRRFQDVWVSTNPPGAKAVLDDDLSMACQTPCMVHATPGTHNLTISEAGYENEYREIRIGDTAQDVPPITLRKPTGTLMLATDPPGANVRVNGQLVKEVTPAQLNLPPGSYSINVEKGGKSQTQQVQIQQSTVYLRIPL